jgi:glutamate synthase (NADPH/NADH) large chain
MTTAPVSPAPLTTAHPSTAPVDPGARVVRTRRAAGLYDPANEHDACGVAMITTLSGEPRHAIVADALVALRNLEHRGASGSEENSGDGAGILVAVPDGFLRAVAPMELPAPGAYAVGTAFLPADVTARAAVVAGVEALAAEEQLRVLGWRDLPTLPELVGPTARSTMPVMRQLFLADARDPARVPVRDPAVPATGVVLDRMAYRLRKRAENSLDVYFPSLSARTLVYKGMLTAVQLEPFYPDLSDPRFASPLAIVHSRFSTNTFPSWPLAHPYRLLAHNGEINTVRGNRNWMRAREALLGAGPGSELPGDLADLSPICGPEASDSASLDAVLELLHLSGRSLPESVLTMIPEAWENKADLDPALRDFYAFNSCLMEPWDGPACVTFTDGTVVGAVLDRNGLRPARYWVTDDGLVVLASEVGVLDIPAERIVRRGRLEPGRMFLADLAQHRIVDDTEIKAGIAAAHPYGQWLAENLVHLEDLPERDHIAHSHTSVTRRQQTFGYTEEELRLLLAPMARSGGEPLGSMGTDTPVAVLSDRPRLLFDYFVQTFAQVTNPPLDAIREELVTSLHGSVGPEHDLLSPGPLSCRQVSVPFPVIDNDDLAKLVHINLDGDLPGYATHVIRGLYRVAGGGPGLRDRLDELCAEVSDAIESGTRIVVLSDRHSDAEWAPIPSLLLIGAVHHHLVRARTRTQVGLVVEAGDVREVHHVALLIGFGAAAVNPYLAMESVEDLAREGVLLSGVDPEKAIANLVKALGKGVLKVMSKMGVSTVASYTGAQLFEAVGLGPALVERYFTGTVSRLGGVGLDVLAEEVHLRHDTAYPASGPTAGSWFNTNGLSGQAHRRLEVGGEYQWRRDGEIHLFDPETVFRLQHATREGRYSEFKRYTARVDDAASRLGTLRGLLRFVEGRRPRVPLEEVEGVESIVRRFATGAMSYGSISAEAHETVAAAMNSLGSRSNSGEGGEDVERLYDPVRRSKVKQVASGRFGVTAEFLTSAEDIQIKMAQGAKPGEGGQLPGHKVYPWIAKTRHSTAGVGLISPPPHHDIYSIEDLAQLIHDLKNANPQARVHVKLVAENGVGTVAAGVSKAHADVVLISGHDGGTGAAPLTSLKHVGLPWELGLAEVQQTLLVNGLRDRITIQADGALKTGRDVVIAALLGAEEFGFSTAPLVVAGCVMMRVCHLDTCPVGVATQNPELRRRFTGQVEHVVNFFRFVAQEVREHLAALGFRTLDEAVGRVDALEAVPAAERSADGHWKAARLDLSAVLTDPADLGVDPDAPRRRTVAQEHGLAKALDNQLIDIARGSLTSGERVRARLEIRNTNRTVGAMLGHELLLRRAGLPPLPDDTIDVTFSGSAGQSFGAFVPAGITLRLHGDANDYVAKGLSGGRVILRPDPAADEHGFRADENVIAGNVIAYGATSGEVFVRGVVGERFCVRNSGATAVAEGVGDHALEYMTGGRVLILGPTGRNLGAGMSGGTAWVLDLDRSRVNGELVVVEPAAADAEQAAALRQLVVRHVAETGSTIGSALLADWPAALARFSAVIPVEYRKALETAARARSEGLDEAATAERIMEAARA